MFRCLHSNLQAAMSFKDCFLFLFLSHSLVTISLAIKTDICEGAQKHSFVFPITRKRLDVSRFFVVDVPISMRRWESSAWAANGMLIQEHVRIYFTNFSVIYIPICYASELLLCNVIAPTRSRLTPNCELNCRTNSMLLPCKRLQPLWQII